MQLLPLTPLVLLLVTLCLQTQEEALPGAGVQASSSCARCHSNAPTASAMRTADGAGVAPFDLWQSTMMANASRDPLWRAVVSAEVAATPSRRAEIEATCLKCHAPMADRVGLSDHGTGSLMSALDHDDQVGELARDGVSCTICHGMSPDRLGTPESFSAGFELDPARRLFGPHQTPLAMPMQRMTGFTPTYAEHINSSALCGSCHTLETEALDPDGHPVGATLLEQAPYLEWINSSFNDTLADPDARAASCQDCHMPKDDAQGSQIQTRIARNPGGRNFPPTKPRNPFGRHLLVGGNTLVLSMLRDNREELGIEAPAAAFQATIDATREQLQQRTAVISIQSVERAADAFSFHVDIENLTGHKFPTAHPTRRAWLRLVVRDEHGDTLFASGASDARGRILGVDRLPLASEQAGGPIEPHRDTIRSGDEVMTYQAVMADANGAPTHTLIRGATWLHDSRILPHGWSAEHPDAEHTEPQGILDDSNFRAGHDRVHFELDLPATGPVTIEASLLYQTLSSRWAAELMQWDTPEIATFRELYEKAELAPEVIARDQATLR